MNRRNFSLVVSSLALPPLSGLLVGTGHAQDMVPKLGKEYLELAKSFPVDVPVGKVEVIEFFSYNCPHCAAFEPALEVWARKLPPQVVFKRMPVPFVGSDIEAKQRLYYTLEAMGKLDPFHLKIFEAIHTARQPLFGDEKILAWAQSQPGLDGKKFADLFKSFSVTGKAKRAAQVVADYKVDGVPAFGVSGRYYADGVMSGNLNRTLEVVDYLIKQTK